MHSATNPPLIAYEANYKRRSGSSCAYTHRKQLFTDEEYNTAVELMGEIDAKDNWPRHFQIKTNKVWTLHPILKKIIPAQSIDGLSKALRLNFASEDARNKALAQAHEMQDNGVITHYHPENPLFAYTGDINDWSHRVKGITESRNYGKTTYVNEDGTKTVPSKEEEEDLENENEEKKKKIILIAIVVVAIVALVILAILKKKGKI